MTIFNSRDIIMLVFTFLHTDLLTSHSPRFETCDVDFYFTNSVQQCIHPSLLRKNVLYKLPRRYHTDIEIPNPFVYGNDFLPGTMFHRINMFSDLIPLVINLLCSLSLKKLGTYRKILLRRFMQLQASSFNYWNDFLRIMKQPIFMDENSYRSRNQIDRYFVRQFIEGLQKSRKLSFYLNYTGVGHMNARLLPTFR